MASFFCGSASHGSHATPINTAESQPKNSSRQSTSEDSRRLYDSFCNQHLDPALPRTNRYASGSAYNSTGLVSEDNPNHWNGSRPDVTQENSDPGTVCLAPFDTNNPVMTTEPNNEHATPNTMCAPERGAANTVYGASTYSLLPADGMFSANTVGNNQLQLTNSHSLDGLNVSLRSHSLGQGINNTEWQMPHQIFSPGTMPIPTQLSPCFSLGNDPFSHGSGGASLLAGQSIMTDIPISGTVNTYPAIEHRFPPEPVLLSTATFLQQENVRLGVNYEQLWGEYESARRERDELRSRLENGGGKVLSLESQLQQLHDRLLIHYSAEAASTFAILDKVKSAKQTLKGNF